MVKRRSYKAAINKLRPFAKGTIAGTVTAAVFTVIGALIFYIADAPEDSDIIMGYISLGVSAAECSSAAAEGKTALRGERSAGLQCSPFALPPHLFPADLPERNFCLS